MNDKASRLVAMLRQVIPSGDISEIHAQTSSLESALESLGQDSKADQYLERVTEGVKAIEQDRPILNDQQFALEAIVMPKYRPVVDVINDNFDMPGDPWTHFGSGPLKANIAGALPSIGRIELPNHPSLPYGGTGFVVGDDLIMTNRHVAEIFTTGLGLSGLAFRQGLRAAIDFVQEVKPRASIPLEVKKVLMIHPYWDMAILQVEGLPAGHPKLRLGVNSPEELAGRDIAVVGYPAQDSRNDLALQMEIFRQQFNVKRMQPGKLRVREEIVDGFQNRVKPLTHDASTLGGNSGSAVIDAATGEVVGLHFSGRYLLANYCVPTYELARDQRVVDLGVSFVNAIDKTTDWDFKWQALGAPERPVKKEVSTTTRPESSTVIKPGSTTITIPLHITVSLGSDQQLSGVVNVQDGDSTALSMQQEALREPVVYPRLVNRKGFNPAFLNLDDDLEIPLPKLSVAGRKVAAKTDDDAYELKYHHFSVVMHKLRRMALLTASNVDWRPEKRLIDGRKPTRRELTGLGENDQEQWVTDPRIPEDHQLPDLFYTKDRQSFDKGHLVRRDDVCWGKTFEDIQKANGDTYHTTNCSPQVAGFNQSARGTDNWGDLESLVQKETKAEKAIVFAGPVFADDDPVFNGVSKHGELKVLIPQRYWKIVVTKGSDGPQAFGFLLEQDLRGVSFEFAVPQAWKRYKKSVVEIEGLLNGLVRFGKLNDYSQ